MEGIVRMAGSSEDLSGKIAELLRRCAPVSNNVVLEKRGAMFVVEVSSKDPGLSYFRVFRQMFPKHAPKPTPFADFCGKQYLKRCHFQSYVEYKH
jgi:hypothetical protein